MSNLNQRHPEDDCLLRYLDGELSGRKTRQVRSHLEACWQCRAQVEELESTIGECVRYRNSVLAPTLPAPPKSWNTLDFDRVEAELATQSLGARLLQFLSPARHPGLRWALSGAAAIGLCFVLLHELRETPKVEAAALLRQAVQASHSRPAAHRRLRVSTRNGQTTRLIGVPYKPAAQELETSRLFTAAHYDWDDPLSAQSYSAWRGQLPHFKDAVASQPDSLDITTTTADCELVSATLRLRSSDLEPIQGRFEFRNHDWVEMTELVDQQTNPASSVAGTAGGMPRQPGVPPVPFDTSGQPAPPSSSEELQVVAALHRLGADLGDPLEITRDGRQVLVSGTGIPPQRQLQIHAQLDRLPHVAVRFDDPAFPAGATLVQSEPAARDAAGTAKSTFPARIEERLGGRPQFERFSSALLDWTDSAMTRAYALRRLAQQFSPESEAGMSAEDRRILHRLAAEHLAAFNKDAQRVANTVKPVLAGIGTPAAILEVRSEPANWQNASEELLASARQAETLLAIVLGVAPAENATAPVPAQLLTALAQVARNAEDCQRLLAAR